jgi:hypothetical protein
VRERETGGLSIVDWWAVTSVNVIASVGFFSDFPSWPAGPMREETYVHMDRHVYYREKIEIATSHPARTAGRGGFSSTTRETIQEREKDTVYV